MWYKKKKIRRKWKREENKKRNIYDAVWKVCVKLMCFWCEVNRIYKCISMRMRVRARVLLLCAKRFSMKIASNVYIQKFNIFDSGKNGWSEFFRMKPARIQINGSIISLPLAVITQQHLIHFVVRFNFTFFTLFR